MLFSSVAYAEEAAQKPNYLNYFKDTVFQKLINADASVWITLGALVALGLILLFIGKSQKKWTAKMIAYGALSIALSFVLSYIRLFRMPQGGSITPGSMLPIMLFSAAYGVGPGLLTGLVYGLLQYLQGGDFLNVWQFLFDYLIAFAALGLAGLHKYMKAAWWRYAVPAVTLILLIGMAFAYPDLIVLYIVLGLVAAALLYLVYKHPDRSELLPAMGVAVLGRAVSAILAGLMWVAAYPLEDGQLPLIYSIVYNGAYLVPELTICMVLAIAMGDRVYKQMKQ